MGPYDICHDVQVHINDAPYLLVEEGQGGAPLNDRRVTLPHFDDGEREKSVVGEISVLGKYQTRHIRSVQVSIFDDINESLGLMSKTLP